MERIETIFWEERFDIKVFGHSKKRSSNKILRNEKIVVILQILSKSVPLEDDGVFG